MAGAGNCPDLVQGPSRALGRGESLAGRYGVVVGGGGGWACASCFILGAFAHPGCARDPASQHSGALPAPWLQYLEGGPGSMGPRWTSKMHRGSVLG